jgi:hypothetical protein
MEKLTYFIHNVSVNACQKNCQKGVNQKSVFLFNYFKIAKFEYLVTYDAEYLLIFSIK